MNTIILIYHINFMTLNKNFKRPDVKILKGVYLFLFVPNRFSCALHFAHHCALWAHYCPEQDLLKSSIIFIEDLCAAFLTRLCISSRVPISSPTITSRIETAEPMLRQPSCLVGHPGRGLQQLLEAGVKLSLLY